MFERFIATSLALPDPTPRCVISAKTGGLSLNHAALELLGRPPRLGLWFDRESGCIGFSGAPEDDRSAAKVSYSVNKRAAPISARSFVQRYQLQPAERLYLELHRDGELVVTETVPAWVSPSPERVRQMVAAVNGR